MQALRSRDATALLDIVADLGAADDIARLRAAIPTKLHALVGADHTSYNEVPLPGRKPSGTASQDDQTTAAADLAVHVEADPNEMLDDAQMHEIFDAHIHQNPILAHHLRTGDTSAVLMSDLVTRRQLHSLDLYDLIYSALGVEHQIAVTLPGDDCVIGITASRRARDFDEQDRAVFAALAPFLRAALRGLRDRARIDATLAALDQARGPIIAILLVAPRRGAMQQADCLRAGNDRAERWLAAAARESPATVQRLVEWARAAVSAGSVQHVAPLHLALAHDALLASFVAGANSRPAAILIERAPGAQPTDAAALRAVGITARQLQVLELVASGHTNQAIAQALGISSRTVAHHLEQSYRRLEVSTRTAAVHRLAELRSG